jgi:ABC-2 type transport system ATP-binding protein
MGDSVSGGVPVVEVDQLVVDYGKGKKKVRALYGISFQIHQGECVGFIGANGAGKSTTIKSLIGFLFPTSGSVRVFGEPAGTAASRQRIGYLPEVALYYPYMKARELLELYGGLHGMSKSDLKTGIPSILKKVGLEGRGESLLRNFSKGMQQRLGIAQSLIAEPEALIFDELSSGLDPLGRHDLRQVLLDLKASGRTIFFSSHELSEVETLCDRVLIIHKGTIAKEASVAELMKPLNRFEIVFRANGAGGLPEAVAQLNPVQDGELYRLIFDDVEAYSGALMLLNRHGLPVQKSSSQTRSLEDYFIDLVGGARKEEQERAS